LNGSSAHGGTTADDIKEHFYLNYEDQHRTGRKTGGEPRDSPPIAKPNRDQVAT
jgi:hypothetical protein